MSREGVLGVAASRRDMGFAVASTTPLGGFAEPSLCYGRGGKNGTLWVLIVCETVRVVSDVCVQAKDLFNIYH